MLLKYRWSANKSSSTFCSSRPENFSGQANLNTHHISIKHHYTFKALSNIPLREQSMIEDDMVWTYFKRIPSICPFVRWCLYWPISSIFTTRTKRSTCDTDDNWPRIWNTPKILLKKMTERLTEDKQYWKNFQNRPCRDIWCVIYWIVKFGIYFL